MTSFPSSGFDVAQLPEAGQRRHVNVLVVSSVALAFISFWRAAAIVLCDLASSAFYVGGISEQAVGKAAPWFILGVMLFSYAVRAVYVESCTMFTRGGVYKVVKGAAGGGLAKLAVSALMFDYILTGPISAVSAGQYLAGLAMDMLRLVTLHTSHPINIDATTPQHKLFINLITVLIALAITIYFWRMNIIGIHESSDKALRIMQLTTVMGVLIIGWSLLTIMLRHEPLHAPPLHPVFTQTPAVHPELYAEPSSGWLEHFPALLGAVGILVAFGHSLLAMSGEESLAQVNREIEAPKLKNLMRAGFVIFVYSMLLTSLVSFLAVILIPDGKRVQTQVVNNGTEATLANRDVTWKEVDYLREGTFDGQKRDWGYRIERLPAGAGDEPHTTAEVVVRSPQTHVERADGGYRDNLINGVVQYLAGPSWIKIAMECFVVIVGFLILAGAVNTSVIGSNGVLNRLAEDGVLTAWFQRPHPRFGTTNRLINLIAVMQVLVILASMGDVNKLGEAYAFGVIWSFVFMTLSMAMLRLKDPSPRQYRVPLNIHVNTKKHGRIDLPVGIFVVFLILLSTALLNLATKKTATIWGVSFTIGFLIVFVIVEKISRRRHGGKHEHLEQFREKTSDAVTIESLGLKHPKPILVAARGPRSLPVLEKILMETDTDKRDVVVVTCKVLPPRTLGVTDKETTVDENDRELLTQIVAIAEHIGKQVYPVVLPTNNPLFAIATAARELKANEVVLGVSEKMHAETQLEQFALAWGSATADPSYSEIAQDMTIRIMGPQVEMKYKMD